MPKVSASWSRLDVKLAGNTMGPDLERDLAEIDVENNLYLPDSFTLRFHLSSLDDRLFDMPDSDLVNYLSQGSEVIIYENYDGDNNIIMDGEVTSVGLEFSDLAPSGQLMAVVQGYDRSHRLHRGRGTMTYNQMSYTDIVSKVARAANLQVDADATSGVPEYVIQSNQTDWEFLWQLANRVGYRLYVNGKTLYFKKGDVLPSPVAELQWGIDLAPVPLPVLPGLPGRLGHRQRLGPGQQAGHSRAGYIRRRNARHAGLGPGRSPSREGLRRVQVAGG